MAQNVQKIFGAKSFAKFYIFLSPYLRHPNSIFCEILQNFSFVRTNVIGHEPREVKKLD